MFIRGWTRYMCIYTAQAQAKPILKTFVTPLEQTDFLQSIYFR